MFFIERVFNALGSYRKIYGTDGLVRVLGALLGGVPVGLCGRVIFAVSLFNELNGARLRLV